MGWRFQTQTILSQTIKPVSLNVNTTRYPLSSSSSIPIPNLFPSLSFSSLPTLKSFQNPNSISFPIHPNTDPCSLFTGRNVDPDSSVGSRIRSFSSSIANRSTNPSSLFALLFPCRPSHVVSAIVSLMSSPETLFPVAEIIPTPNSSMLNRNPFRPISISSGLHSSLLFIETLVASRNPKPISLVMNSSRHSICYLSRPFSIVSSGEDSGDNFRIQKCNLRRTRRVNPNSRLNLDGCEEIIELIEKGGEDMEMKLNQMNLWLSVASVSDILSLLNDRGVSALRFFNWVQKSHSDFNPNSEIYNQIINNIGHSEQYDSMLALLVELSLKRHCLTDKSFGFLTVFSVDQSRIGNSVERIVEILNKIRGSCRNSGVYALIKKLCALNSFDLAIFVMEETVRKTSYYNVLIAAKCRNGDFQEARELFDEMKRFGCDPSTKSYNYLLGSLCKKDKIAETCELLEIMESLGYLPDSITFEVVAFHACRLGRMDVAIKFLYQMMAEGHEPRNTTHAAFIKGYFWSKRVKDAHKYVVEMSGKDKHSSNMNYSLLASLFQKSGRAVEAREILVEMIEKGLKPNFPVYMRVIKDLYKMGKGDMITDLKCRFSTFYSSTEVR